MSGWMRFCYIPVHILSFLIQEEFEKNTPSQTNEYWDWFTHIYIQKQNWLTIDFGLGRFSDLPLFRCCWPFAGGSWKCSVGWDLSEGIAMHFITGVQIFSFFSYCINISMEIHYKWLSESRLCVKAVRSVQQVL